MTQNELYHYGVLGMKWGMRRATRKGSAYTYKSRGQKKWEKKLNKAERKGKSESKIRVTKEKLETFKMRDQNRQDYASTTGAGRSFVKTLLFGPFGAGNYNRLRSAGNSRLYSAAASNIVASTAGLPFQVLISRSSEFNSAKMRKRGYATR